jgi:hypothetical protein
MLGTIIARVLARFGVKKTAGCRCDEREAALNRLGLSTLTNLSRAYHATRGLTIF